MICGPCLAGETNLIIIYDIVIWQKFIKTVVKNFIEKLPESIGNRIAPIVARIWNIPNFMEWPYIC